MNRGLITVIIGIAAGVLAYNLYFNNFKPCDEDTLECQLERIQDYLALSPDQFDLVLALHRDRQPEIDQLEQKVRQLEDRLMTLEAERIENDRIDFMAFYGYLQEKVDLDKTRDSSTESFLTKVESIMNPDQKERFHQLLRDYNHASAEGS